MPFESASRQEGQQESALGTTYIELVALDSEPGIEDPKQD